MSNPLVSVIVPAYNHERFIEDTITSVIAQDYSPLELLVLDDGSCDKTYERLAALQPRCEKRFERVWMTTRPNQGTTQTLNQLVCQCRGKYVLSCASDDMLLPDCISRQVALMEENPELVQTLPDNFYIDAQGRRLERVHDKKDTYCPLGTDSKNYPTFASFWKAQMPENYFCSDQFHSYASLLLKHTYLNGSLWRTQTLRQFFPLPSCRLAEDHYINLQFAKRGQVRFLDKPLFNYRIHRLQTIQNVPLLRRYEQNLFLEELKQVSRPGQEKWKEILKQVWFTPVCKRKGTPWLYLERQNSFVCSKRLLGIFGLKISLHTRYKHPLPAWWRE